MCPAKYLLVYWFFFLSSHSVSLRTLLRCQASFFFGFGGPRGQRPQETLSSPGLGAVAHQSWMFCMCPTTCRQGILIQARGRSPPLPREISRVTLRAEAEIITLQRRARSHLDTAGSMCTEAASRGDADKGFWPEPGLKTLTPLLGTRLNKLALRKAPDTFKFLRRVMRAILSARPKYHWTENYYITSCYFSELITFDVM